LLAALESFAGHGGLLPEQVWDTDDIPERELYRGHPSGSAMPLVWAHAEHVKLLRSLADGAVFDMPPQTVRRYLRDKPPPRIAIWRPDLPVKMLPRGRVLRIDLPDAARIRWTANGWSHVTEIDTSEPIEGLHVAELPTSDIPSGGQLIFTWQMRRSGAWVGRNQVVDVGATPDR
jgi:glucoamylase